MAFVSYSALRETAKKRSNPKKIKTPDAHVLMTQSRQKPKRPEEYSRITTKYRICKSALKKAHIGPESRVDILFDSETNAVKFVLLKDDKAGYKISDPNPNGSFCNVKFTYMEGMHLHLKDGATDIVKIECDNNKTEFEMGALIAFLKNDNINDKSSQQVQMELD